MKRTKYIFGIILLVVITAAIAFYHEVDNTLTANDKTYIPEYTKTLSSLSGGSSFDEEIRFITGVQNNVLRIANKELGIPHKEKRGPKELFEAKHGLCFDRSRVIEKILRHEGFKTRHIAMYTIGKTGSALNAIITPESIDSGVNSHAITEVLTKKGWLVVDSNHHWISLGENNAPISMDDIQNQALGGKKVYPKKPIPNIIYTTPFTHVYGLYSRHGEFYPPYNKIPDVNYSELIQNIL